MADNFNLERLQAWYQDVLTTTMPHLTIENATSLAYAAAARVIEYAKERPYITAFQIVAFALTPILGAGWMLRLTLGQIGFGSLGPTAGTLATWYQSTYLGGYIPAGSLFAWAQRAAMG